MPKIQLKSNGQYVVTIDKGIGDAMDLAGADAEWSIASRNKLELQITSRQTDE
ncbi:hypothetical protein SAMN05444422_11112 [Halobiforma haloterrestris]|uniref:Uncharacterized protein n=1 Tax=Natronobacterium haloterrestre TaxID=148448 RepID=A0A1I1KBS7_NATHA|nr:hypothetical protein SAMN05444422_11112 [Halobiforma haloterrestris]